MPSISIDRPLYERIQKAAQRERATVEDFLAAAVNRYLSQLENDKISQENQWYLEKHEQLKAKYLGSYIALRNGEVIDSDPDFQVLRRRIRLAHGQFPVMITKVEEKVEPVYTQHGFVEE